MISKKQVALPAIIICVFLLPGIAFSELKSLDDSELSAIYAEGFSDFSITDLGYDNLTETKAWFNIYADTYTTIDSLKLGYHDEYNYKDPTPGFGWDQDWEDVQIGGDLNDPTKDWHAEGFYFNAVFENINDPATRELKSITFGADYVRGDITADFNNFSGTIDDSNNGTPEYNGHALNLGTRTISADPLNTGTGSSFALSLSIDGYDKGYWVDFTKAVVSP